MSDETTDVSEAQAEDPEALREALLDQMAYLVDEIEALRSVVGTLPDAITSGRPAPDALTMKELYAALATLDEAVRSDRVAQIAEDEAPSFESVDVDEAVREAGWNEKDIDDILRQVQDAREALVDQLTALPLEAWHHSATLDGDTVTLFDLVHRMTQADAERLRDLGYRLHGAHLSDRDEPLPT
jgi:hypothetical protein